MPEIKQAHKDQFVGPQEKIEFNSIPYQEKQREASRLLKLKEYKKTGVWPSSKKKKVVSPSSLADNRLHPGAVVLILPLREDF